MFQKILFPFWVAVAVLLILAMLPLMLVCPQCADRVFGPMDDDWNREDS